LDQTAYQADEREQPALRVIAEAHGAGGQRLRAGHHHRLCRPGQLSRQTVAAALRLHIERGHFGRDPYPFSMYFDHVGTHGRSAVGSVGGLKLAYPLTSDGRALVSAFRAQMTAAFNSRDPFQTQALRRRFDRLCLASVQVSNEFFLDGLVSYRTQFEYLYDVWLRLRRMSR
jgi:hypothetical protein